MVSRVGYVEIHSVTPDGGRTRECSAGDECRYDARSQYHLSDDAVIGVGNIKIGAVTPDALGLNSCNSRERGHRLRAQHHLADGLIVRVGDEQISGTIASQ